MIQLKLSEDKKTINIVEASLNSEKSSIYKYFKKKSKDADFNVLVDRGIWDGMDHFMTKQGSIQVGLWKEIYNFSKQSNIDVRIDGIDDVLDLNIDQDSLLEKAFHESLKSSGID